MQDLTLEQVADFIETATIEESHDFGHSILHIGKTAAGARFALMNDCFGKSVLIEAA